MAKYHGLETLTVLNSENIPTVGVRRTKKAVHLPQVCQNSLTSAAILSSIPQSLTVILAATCAACLALVCTPMQPPEPSTSCSEAVAGSLLPGSAAEPCMYTSCSAPRVADVGKMSHAGHAEGKAQRVHGSPQEPSERPEMHPL